MPLETIEAFQDHGEVRGDTSLEGVDEAEKLLDAARGRRRRLRRRVATLEAEGVQKFIDSFDQIVEGIGAKRGDAGRRVTRRRELVERIWARDPTVWTGADEAQWLGWLDEPWRMREDVDLLLQLADSRRRRIDAVVLLGMGGSSLAPEVIKRTFGRDRSTSSTRRIRRRSAASRRSSTSSARCSSRASKSGSTLETRSHTDYFWEKHARRGEQWVAITDPGSALEELAREREFRAVFAGEPTIGGRYSALSPFGLVPAALMGVDLDAAARPRVRDGRRVPARRGQPGARARARARRGLARRAATRSASAERGRLRPLGRSSCSPSRPGSRARGSCPRPASRPTGPTARRRRCGSPDPYELGQEFFRWEFATAVAGSILGINPFDQPDVQAAKDKTRQCSAGRRAALEPEARPRSCSRSAEPGDYVCDPGVRRPDRGRREAEPGAARRASAAARRAASSRTASGRATCTRPASCTRAARPPGSSCRWSTTPARSCRSRAAVRLRQADPRPGGGRLRVAARARPPRRAHPTGGGV